MRQRRGDAQPAHLSLLAHLLERANQAALLAFLHRRVVELHDIYRVGLQPAQALLQVAQHVFPGPEVAVIRRPALRSQVELGAPVGDVPPDKLLAVAIVVRRIDQVDPRVEHRVQQPFGLLLGHGAPVGRAVAQAGHVEPGAAEQSGGHRFCHCKYVLSPPAVPPRTGTLRSSPSHRSVYLAGCGKTLPDLLPTPSCTRKEEKLYLRDTLRLPAKGLCPSAHPIFQQPPRAYQTDTGVYTNGGPAVPTGAKSREKTPGSRPVKLSSRSSRLSCACASLPQTSGRRAPPRGRGVRPPRTAEPLPRRPTSGLAA